VSSKTEIGSAVIEWLDFIKNQIGLQPQIIYIDGFREIINWLRKIYAKRGITLNVTALYTAEQNDRAERAGRTLNS